MALLRTLACVALLAGPLAAQPVLTQTQTGHALDANPSVGSRYNPQVNSNNNALNGQYLITGQSRLGRSFRGPVPYGAVGQFQSTLGSGTLYEFERDSTSLPMVLRSGGNVAAPVVGPYLDSSRTVFGADRIDQDAYGQTTRTVLNPFAHPAYAPIQPVAPASPLAASQALFAPLSSTMVLPNLPLADQINYRREALTQQGRLGDALDHVANPLYGLRPGEGVLDRGGALPVGPIPPITPQSPIVRLTPIRPQDGQAGQTETTPPAQPAETDRPPARPPAPGPGDAAARAAGALAPGQDLYSDLLGRARDLLGPAAADAPTGQAGQPGADRGTSPAGQTPDALGPTPGQLPPPPTIEDIARAGRPVQPDTPLTRMVKPIVVDLNVRLPSYVSAIPTRANLLLQQAETLLARRRYYDAMGALSEARSADPANPLLWLRSSHASLGAGEYATSADCLARAIRLFPSVASVRGELPGLSGTEGAAVLADRIRELGELAERTGRADLWMLLCYVQWVVGSPEQAGRIAGRLAGMDSASPQARALVALVLPSRSPTTAPGD